VSEEFCDDAGFSSGVCEFCPFWGYIAVGVFLVLLFCFLFHLGKTIIHVRHRIQVEAIIVF
jgi:hypothetical protein